MAYARSADELHDFTAAKSTTESTPKSGRGFFRRAFDAMVEGRRRMAEREIEVFMRGRGGYLTDETEREINRILSSSTHL
jgi:hypothetical protein